MQLMCPKCKARGVRSELDIAEHKSDTRSVEEKIRFVCRLCGWLSDVYAF